MTEVAEEELRVEWLVLADVLFATSFQEEAVLLFDLLREVVEDEECAGSCRREDEHGRSGLVEKTSSKTKTIHIQYITATR